MHTLTLFYDARCGLCSRVRQWLSGQPSYVRLEFIPYDSAEAERRLPGIRHLRADQEILVMADTGEVWQGAGAWSPRLASPAMQGMARKIVHWISQNRIGISRLLHFKSDIELTAAAERDMQEPLCRLRHDLDLID
jgi:hypothetical protein